MDDKKTVSLATEDGKPIPKHESSRESQFTFDKAFGDNDNTEDVYSSCVKGIVDSTLNGINGTIFAYGQTSSGTLLKHGLS